MGTGGAMSRSSTVGPAATPSGITQIGVRVNNSPDPAHTAWQYQVEFRVPERGDPGVKLFK